MILQLYAKELEEILACDDSFVDEQHSPNESHVAPQINMEKYNDTIVKNMQQM